MNNNKLNINKTKYEYLKDNLSLFPVKPIITYTIPVPKKEENSDTEFFDRNYPDVKISNIKLNSMINKTAKALLALGVKKGDIVTICHTNTPETIYMDYALNLIGAIPSYIYPNLTSGEIKFFIDELNSKYLFILDDEPIRENVKKALDNDSIKIISSTPIESFPGLFKVAASSKMKAVKRTELPNEIKWNDFIKNGKKINAIDKANYIPNTVSTYVHTSGTSNVPKAVMLSNENCNCMTMNFEIDGVNWVQNDIAVQTIPQFVAYGIVTNHLYLCNNINTVLIPEMEPKNFYDLIKKYKPSYSFTTPSHARELIKRPTDMSKTKMFYFGGDGFDDVEKKMNEYIRENGGNVVAFQGYGATEMSAATINTSPLNHKIGSVGKLIGKTEGKIVEPGTFNEITAPNTIGELCLTGPGLTLGYAGNSKELTEDVFIKHPDGKTYVHMGDLMSKDEDGFFYYNGRMKNVITRKSFTFSPKEIEDAIMKHKNVKQCIVIPKYSKDEGETPSAHIVLNDYSNVEKTMEEIIELVNCNVQEFHRPTDYKIREEIIRTRNNKNNLTALKIEDTVMLFPGVLNATINNSEDNNYEYDLQIRVDSNIVNNNIHDLIEEIKVHIKKIANILKFNVGEIKYNINYVDLKYVDSDVVKEIENINKYVKKI